MNAIAKQVHWRFWRIHFDVRVLAYVPFQWSRFVERAHAGRLVGREDIYIYINYDKGDLSLVPDPGN